MEAGYDQTRREDADLIVYAVNLLNVMEEAKAVLKKIMASHIDGSYVAAASWWQEAKAVLAKLDKGV